MSYIVVDIESDGPIPGDFSMICFGAVIVEESLEKTFYGKLKPISEKWIPEALSISGFTREETLEFDKPTEVLLNFENWIKANQKTKELLNHEQRHFDIAKIYSNKLQKIVDEKIKNIKDYNENFQKIYNKIYSEYFDYQTKYEEVTERGLNFESQKLIDKEIDEKLIEN